MTEITLETYKGRTHLCPKSRNGKHHFTESGGILDQNFIVDSDHIQDYFGLEIYCTHCKLKLWIELEVCKVQQIDENGVVVDD